jgi:hypothetical protein
MSDYVTAFVHVSRMTPWFLFYESFLSKADSANFAHRGEWMRMDPRKLGRALGTYDYGELYGFAERREQWKTGDKAEVMDQETWHETWTKKSENDDVNYVVFQRFLWA